MHLIYRWVDIYFFQKYSQTNTEMQRATAVIHGAICCHHSCCGSSEIRSSVWHPKVQECWAGFRGSNGVPCPCAACGSLPSLFFCHYGYAWIGHVLDLGLSRSLVHGTGGFGHCFPLPVQVPHPLLSFLSLCPIN